MSTTTGTRKRRRSKNNADAPAAPNLFAAAGEKEKEEPKKPKGTVFHLPKDLDSEGKLTFTNGDSFPTTLTSPCHTPG